MIQYLPLKMPKCTFSLELVFLSVTTAWPSAISALPFLMQLFSTLIEPLSFKLYSAVEQVQSFSKLCGKRAISYHLPRYLSRSTLRTVSNGSSFSLAIHATAATLARAADA